MYSNPYSYGVPQFQPPSFPQSQQPTNQLIRVSGIDGARAYGMGANESVALFDSASDVMYIKSTDGAGFPTIRTFAFTPVEDVKQETNDFVTRKEFDDFKEALNAVVPVPSSKS